MIEKKPKKKGKSKLLLIKGSLEKIPAEVMEEESFRKTLREIMKDWSGIYVLYKDDKIYYIGKATSGFWRLWNHFKRSKHSGKWNKFSIFRFRTKNLIDIETLLLRISKPKGNKSIPRIPKDMELTKILKKEMKESRKKAQSIEKALKG